MTSSGGEVRQIVVSVPSECCSDHQNGHSMPRYEIISVRERHGRFRKAVPLLPVPVAVVLCVLNVILPGIARLFDSHAKLLNLGQCSSRYEIR
ncbi:hypothetical protein HPB47_027496 [Ixodes persulcatus]|uniref:Uncharacterized protein n=1 Tax=Ixodes persulcatus TaxID=34615 RepID=A0AC60PXG6_IXOPE|nr:hypothetical protein HPB47_027496 [Ixodes persulcatus]